MRHRRCLPVVVVAVVVVDAAQQRVQVTMPVGLGVDRLHLSAHPFGRPRRVEAAKRVCQRLDIVRFGDEPVDALAHVVSQCPGASDDDRHSELEGDPYRLRTGCRAIRQHQGVDIAEECGDVICIDVARAELDPVGDTEFVAERRDRVDATPDLTGYPQADVVRPSGERAQQNIQPLVRPDKAEEQQSAMFAEVRVAAGERRRRCRRKRYGAYWAMSQAAGEFGLLRRVHEHDVGGLQQPRHECGVAAPALVRQHVVAEHRDRGWALTATQRSDHREIRRYLDRRHVGEDDEVG